MRGNTTSESSLLRVSSHLFLYLISESRFSVFLVLFGSHTVDRASARTELASFETRSEYMRLKFKALLKAGHSDCPPGLSPVVRPALRWGGWVHRQ